MSEPTWEIRDADESDAVILPISPLSATMTQQATPTIFKMPTTKPLILSLGQDVDKLTIEGILVYPGYTKAQLETNYLTPLSLKMYKEVKLYFPDTRYDGLWIFILFKYTEESRENIVSFKYSMEFIRGSTHMVV